MDTLTGLRALVSNPRFSEQRRRSLSDLDILMIDPPIADLIRDLGRLPCCFTLQSCFGHFLSGGQRDPRNTEPLPVSDSTATFEYRIAYLALCIEDSEPGRALFDALRQISAIDPEYVQFACADWFWERQVNSFVLQVEPARFMTRDRALIGYQEALHTERIRNRFFAELGVMVRQDLQASVRS